MGHHSEEPFNKEEFERLIQKMKDTSDFRGAIGAYPQGMLTKSDEGAIQFAVGEKDGKVILDFGTPVSWIGMNAQDAADLAQTLFKWAREVGRKNGEVIHMTIG